MLLILLTSALLAAGGECPIVFDRGRAAYDSRRYDAAIAEFQSALALCPQRGKALQALGQAQLMAQRLDDAAATLQQLARLEPQNATARKLLGDALYLSGKEVEAEQSLKEAIALDPANESALYALARIYYQQNRFSEAVGYYQKVLELDPKNYRAHDNLAVCYGAMYRDAEALKHFFKALELVQKDHPEYDWAHANLAEFFLKRNQYEKAFQLAAEAAHRNPNSARNCFLTAKALVGLNKEELSVRWLECAVRIDPNYREAHYLLARAYQKVGRKEDSERELEKFRELAQTPSARR